VHRPADPLQQPALLRVAEPSEQRPVDGHHPGGAVGDQRATHVVDDETAGGLDHQLADRLLGGLGLVRLATEHLHVPEPREQREEQREHQRLDDDEPDPPRRALGGQSGDHQ
jgi:hypothetical protein